MKAKHIILYVICIAAVALGFYFFKALMKHNEKAEKIERIPEITLVTIDGVEFPLAERKRGRRAALLFFSPDCEYCRKEIEGIVANRDSFEKTDWVFITLAPEGDLHEFLLEYPLESVPGAKVVREEWPELFLALDVTAPPTLFIYDSDGRLEHFSRGAVSIKTILEWLD